MVATGGDHEPFDFVSRLFLMILMSNFGRIVFSCILTVLTLLRVVGFRGDIIGFCVGGGEEKLLSGGGDVTLNFSDDFISGDDDMNRSASGDRISGTSGDDLTLVGGGDDVLSTDVKIISDGGGESNFSGAILNFSGGGDITVL